MKTLEVEGINLKKGDLVVSHAASQGFGDVLGVGKKWITCQLLTGQFPILKRFCTRFRLPVTGYYEKVLGC